MTLSMTTRMRSMLERRTHYQATCWEIRRRDGIKLYLTDHNTKLVLSDGQTYTPIGAGNASAEERSAGLQEANGDYLGVVSSSAITFDDLIARRYDEAVIIQKVVDWRYPWMGEFRKLKFWIVSAEFDGEQWTAHISSLPSQLRVGIGETHSRDCLNILGDSRCRVNLASSTYSAAVPVTTVQTAKLVFRSSSLTGYADEWFTLGTVLWTVGANAGIECEVKSFVSATGQVELFEETPFTITATDSFTITAGCDGLFGTCKTKFSNVLNFRGYPYMPGTNVAIRNPGA